MRKTLAVAMFAALTAAGAAQAQTAKMTPELKALVEAANKEGEIVIKTSNNFFDGTRGIKMYTEHLNAAYGTKITVKWTPGGSYPEVGNEVAVSIKNNLPSPTDMYIGFSRNMFVFQKQDMFEKVDWKSYDPERLNDRIIEDGIYVKAYSATLGFTYNTELAKSKPETVADFLKPEWKGKVATTPFGAGFEQLSAKESWGPEKTLEFAKTFASQSVAGFMLCTEPERVASGEFWAFVTDCGGGSMVKASLNGAPIKRVVTPDTPLISYFYYAIPKNAPHSAAGKLFVVYSMSKQGQADMYDLTYADNHLYPDSKMRPSIVEVEKKFGITFGDADIAWQGTNDAGNANQQKVAKIFQESGK
jgi:putative spermidine/putrescine transport system substrate-binding protein